MIWKNDGDQVIIIGWQGELTIPGLAEIGLNPHRIVRTPMGPVTLRPRQTITLMFKHAGHVKVT